MADGIFFHVGPHSKPVPDQSPVRLADITDGTASTLFFGERNRWDPHYNTFADQGWDWAFRNYGNWCGTSGQALAHVTLSTYSPLHYRLPRASQCPAAAVRIRASVSSLRTTGLYRMLLAFRASATMAGTSDGCRP